MAFRLFRLLCLYSEASFIYTFHFDKPHLMNTLGAAADKLWLGV